MSVFDFRQPTVTSSGELTAPVCRRPRWQAFGDDFEASYRYKIGLLELLEAVAASGRCMRPGAPCQSPAGRLLCLDDLLLDDLLGQNEVPVDNMMIDTVFELLADQGTPPTPGELINYWIDINYIPAETVDIYTGVERYKKTTTDCEHLPPRKRYNCKEILPYLCTVTDQPDGCPSNLEMLRTLRKLWELPEDHLAALDLLVPAFRMSESTDKIFVRKEKPLHVQRRLQEFKARLVKEQEERNRCRTQYEYVRSVTSRRELFKPSDDAADVTIDAGFVVRDPPAGIFELAADASHEISPKEIVEVDNNVYELEATPVVLKAPATYSDAATQASESCWFCSLRSKVQTFVQGLWTSAKKLWTSA